MLEKSINNIRKQKKYIKMSVVRYNKDTIYTYITEQQYSAISKLIKSVSVSNVKVITCF